MFGPIRRRLFHSQPVLDVPHARDGHCAGGYGAHLAFIDGKSADHHRASIRADPNLQPAGMAVGEDLPASTPSPTQATPMASSMSSHGAMSRDAFKMNMKQE